MNILDEIVASKRLEVMQNRRETPVKKLEGMPYFKRNTLSLASAIRNSQQPAIIAEFKRRSPSRGNIRSGASVADIVKGYQDAGASAVSVLTDQKYFGGSLNDLQQAREFLNIPLLRKDFIVDEYQVLEAKAYGADLILLIAASLSKYEVSHLSALACSLGMEILFEIHEESELDKLSPLVSLVGVNNRDLTDFTVSVDTSVRLAEKIPSEFIRISESGIGSLDLIRMLFQKAYQGFLMGEAFMKTSDPASACQALIQEISKQ